MSIDFSKVKSMTIPEGVVTQITDENGVVLWSAAKKVTITLTGSLSTTGNYVEHNGIKYGSAGTFEAAIGDTITVHAGTAPSSATIYLNGTQVSSALSTTTYSYTVKCNTTINGVLGGSGTSMTAKMYITEIPEGQILFAINGTNYFADEGMTWAEWFASAYNTTGKTADDVQSISANGVTVELSAVIVGGTAYEVGFAKPMATVIVYSYSPGPYYESTMTFPDEIASEGTYELPIGTELVFSIFAGKKHEGHISVNYEQVAYASGDSSAEYTYVLNGNIRVEGYMNSYGPSININEE